jgi:hypothetical protein
LVLTQLALEFMNTTFGGRQIGVMAQELLEVIDAGINIQAAT